MALGKAPPIRGLGSQDFAGRKVLGTNHDEAAGGRAPAERPAEVLRDVPAVREGFALACHARLQCRSVPSVGKRKDTQKHADPKVGGRR